MDETKELRAAIDCYEEGLSTNWELWAKVAELLAEAVRWDKSED